MTIRVASLVLLLCSCAQRAPAPSIEERPPFPDMSGRTIMVLPVQAATPVVRTAGTGGTAASLDPAARATLEAELSFWLEQAAPRVRWILPAAVERAAERARVLDVRPRDLPVQDFLRARLEAIGDPLYGELRKLGALLDTRPALLPIGAVWITDADGTGRVHLLAALIDTTGGSVIWQGVVAGSSGARPDAATLASAAEALARLAAR